MLWLELVLPLDPDFLNPLFLKLLDFLNQFLFPLEILLCNFTPYFLNHLIFLLKPIYVSLGGLRNWDSTLIHVI